MKKTIYSLLTVALVMSTFSYVGLAKAAGNLITNGSFEEPVVTSGSKWQLMNSVPGWSVEKTSDDTATTLEFHRGWSGNVASEGQQYIELAGNEPDRIYQDIDTCVGGTYNVSYAWAPRQGVDSAIKVYWAGAEIGSHNGIGANGALNWTVTLHSQTALSDITRIQIEEVGSNSMGMFFDNVVVEETYCPPYDRTAEITSPSEDEIVTGLVSFDALLDDEDGNDNVQWAVRQGTCAVGVGTVLGNVDGHSDSYDWNGDIFHAEADSATWADGAYCFIFNPTESSGDIEIRETLEFFVSNPPTEVSQCKKGGWETFSSPKFKNQGDCVSWLQSNENAKGNKKDN